MLLRLIVLLASGFALGWISVPEVAPDAILVQPKRPAVAVPAWRPPGESGVDALLPAVMTAPFWGAGPTASVALPAPPPPESRWRVAGVFGIGANRKLRVEFRNPARAGETLKVGDKLPSGHVITRINERTFCVDIEGTSYTLGVERSE